MGRAATVAKAEQIEIRSYDVIYDAIDDVQRAIARLVAPTVVEKLIGKTEVPETFRIGKAHIAGCVVVDGSIRRAGRVRLVRDAALVCEGGIAGLRRFKDEARDVGAGLECGVLLDGWSGVDVGDVLECYVREEVSAR